MTPKRKHDGYTPSARSPFCSMGRHFRSDSTSGYIERDNDFTGKSAMPQIVNGCGTWYYGKKNLQSYEGRCRACSRIATLTSYDTRLYVVFVMIPIIPLGKKRIIEQCGACTRH